MSSKTKSGKPLQGSSSLDAAPVALAEGLASYQQHPEVYSVYTVQEVVGVPKKGAITDFMLKTSSPDTHTLIDVIVPKVFLSKSDKLVVREMGVKGAKIAVRQSRAQRERLLSVNGVSCLRSVIETDYIFVALLP